MNETSKAWESKLTGTETKVEHQVFPSVCGRTRRLRHLSIVHQFTLHKDYSGT